MKFHSEFGQDEWVDTVLGGMPDGFFVDIGAAHPSHGSNTYALEKHRDWKGVCVDIRGFAERCRDRSSAQFCGVVSRHEGMTRMSMKGGRSHITGEKNHFVQSWPLEKLLKAVQAPKMIDLLSIDVEGFEKEVISAIDFNERRFRIIIIEWPDQWVDEFLFDRGYKYCGLLHKDRIYAGPGLGVESVRRIPEFPKYEPFIARK